MLTTANRPVLAPPGVTMTIWKHLESSSSVVQSHSNHPGASVMTFALSAGSSFSSNVRTLRALPTGATPVEGCRRRRGLGMNTYLNLDHTRTARGKVPAANKFYDSFMSPPGSFNAHACIFVAHVLTTPGIGVMQRPGTHLSIAGTTVVVGDVAASAELSITVAVAMIGWHPLSMGGGVDDSPRHTGCGSGLGRRIGAGAAPRGAPLRAQ